MTALLQHVFAKIAQLPPEEQDTWATWLLEEVIEEEKWQKSFADSPNLLAELAEEALQDHCRHNTMDNPSRS